MALFIFKRNHTKDEIYHSQLSNQDREYQEYNIKNSFIIVVKTVNSATWGFPNLGNLTFFGKLPLASVYHFPYKKNEILSTFDAFYKNVFAMC